MTNNQPAQIWIDLQAAAHVLQNASYNYEPTVISPATAAAAMSVYCRSCSSAPGTPCSDPLTGYEWTVPHRQRVLLYLTQESS